MYFGEILQPARYSHNNPDIKWFERGFLVFEWKSPWQLTTVGQHVEDKKWQTVTSVFPCSFNFKTKGLLKSASEWVCSCLSLCFPILSSYFWQLQINQIDSYQNVGQSKINTNNNNDLHIDKLMSDNWSIRFSRIVSNSGWWGGEGWGVGSKG